MRIILTEKQLRKLVEDISYPSQFNLEYFRNIKTFNDRVKYCNMYLQRIASGSSRIVYKIDDNTALKIAKNTKGIAQNNAENDWYLQSCELFSHIINSDDKNTWIEVELAKKAKPSDFKRLTGYSFDVICDWIDYCHSAYSRYGLKNFKYKELFDSDEFVDNMEYTIFYELNDYLGNYQLEAIGDLKRISSWGIVNKDGEERLVLVDYGLNDSVNDEFYSRKRR